MTSSEQRQLWEDQVRHIVVNHIAQHHITVDEIGQMLKVSQQMVSSLLLRPHWDLELGLLLARQMNIPLAIVVQE